MSESFTEDGRIVSVELDVMRDAAVNDDAKLAFLLDAENQFLAEDGTWRQVLWERTCYPVCMVKPGKDPDMKKLLNQIYKESKEIAISDEFKKSGQENKMSGFLWIVSIICATFIIIAGMNFLGG
jgi:hypothetical protein